MSKFTVNKSKDYTVLSNHHLRDKNLSLKAKGLLTVMLSLPDDWDYSINGLVAICLEGKGSITSTIKELEENNYLIRTLEKDNLGKFIGYNYDVYEKPFTDKPYTNNPLTENPLTDNQPQLNTKQSITKKQSTKQSNTNKETFVSIIDGYTDNEELKQALNDFVVMRKTDKKFTTRALTLNINKLNRIAVNDLAKIEIVNQTIMNGWKSFYPIKENARDANREQGGYAF